MQLSLASMQTTSRGNRLKNSRWLILYSYHYMCVCVCVCVCTNKHVLIVVAIVLLDRHASLNKISTR